MSKWKLLLSTAVIASAITVLPSVGFADNTYQIESLAIDENGTKSFPNSREVDYPNGGVVLGAGWNSITDEPVDSVCLNFTPKSSNGQEADLSIVRVDEKDELRREIGISYGATATAKFGKAGGSVSAKREFLNKSSLTKHALNVLVKAKVVNGVSFVAPLEKQIGDTPKGTISLNPYAQSIINSENAQMRSEFYEKCGDSFVSGVVRGAEIYALYNMRSTKATEEETAGIELHGSGSYIGFSASADYSSSSVIDKIRSFYADSITYYHSAHRGLPLPYKEEQISDSLQYLGNADQTNDAFPFRVLIRRYDSLPEFKIRLSQGRTIDEQRESYRQRLLGMASYLTQVIDLTREASSADDPYNLKIRGKDLSYYKQLQDRIYQEAFRVEGELEACFQDRGFGTDSISKLCLADETPLYSDWLFRLEMPIHKDLLRDLYGDEQEEKERFEAEATSWRSQYDNFVIESYWRHHDCNIFGRSCRHEHIVVKCSNLPSHHKCREYKRKEQHAQTQAAQFEAGTNIQRDKDTRFGRWIIDASRARLAANDINGYLSNSQLDVLKSCLLEQYHKPEEAEEEREITCSERLINGERLAIVDQFVPRFRLERDSAMTEAAANAILSYSTNMPENLSPSAQKQADSELSNLRQIRDLAQKRQAAGEEFLEQMLAPAGIQLRNGVQAQVTPDTLSELYQDWLTWENQKQSEITYMENQDSSNWKFSMPAFDSKNDFKAAIIQY